MQTNDLINLLYKLVQAIEADQRLQILWDGDKDTVALAEEVIEALEASL